MGIIHRNSDPLFVVLLNHTILIQDSVFVSVGRQIHDSPIVYPTISFNITPFTSTWTPGPAPGVLFKVQNKNARLITGRSHYTETSRLFGTSFVYSVFNISSTSSQVARTASPDFCNAASSSVVRSISSTSSIPFLPRMVGTPTKRPSIPYWPVR